MTTMFAHPAIWAIAALASAGVIVRPFGWPEAVWAVAGAALLVILRLITPQDALTGIFKGADVYLFLVGMMLLAETARGAGVFAWLAAIAVKLARGSAKRLFLLIYGVGTLVTIFLSNDATAVVLTPAVAAAVKVADVRQPLPYLLICAFIANAASFVLPISNPANLVLYASHTPPLLQWIPRYLPASLASILMTYAVLRWTERDALSQRLAQDIPVPSLSGAGKTALAGIAATAAVLMGASALDRQLGLPTAIAGALTAALVIIHGRKSPWGVLKDISWSVLPLVAGLFVLVEALSVSGLVGALGGILQEATKSSVPLAAWGAGLTVAFASNLINNLPAGLIAGGALQGGTSDPVTRAVLIGVDLGPNLSVTGSLATILWLAALRREGQNVSALAFLRLGLLIMPPALIIAIAASWVLG